jgi:hypothetical protein
VNREDRDRIQEFEFRISNRSPAVVFISLLSVMYDATKGVAIYDPLRFFGVNVRATCMECSFETLTNARCAVATIRYMAMVRSPYR